MASPLTVISGVTTVFQNVDAYAGDPILSLMEAFQQDPQFIDNPALYIVKYQ